MNTNPYLQLGASIGVPGTEPLLRRLAEWHDTMVAHERAAAHEPCGDDCAHAQARVLWQEVTARFGRGAGAFVFLKSRASWLREAA